MLILELDLKNPTKTSTKKMQGESFKNMIVKVWNYFCNYNQLGIFLVIAGKWEIYNNYKTMWYIVLVNGYNTISQKQQQNNAYTQKGIKAFVFFSLLSNSQTYSFNEAQNLFQ